MAAELDRAESELRELATRFYANPLLELRKRVLWSFAGAVLLLVFLGWLTSMPLLACAALCLALLSTIAYAAVSGWNENSYLFQKCRDLALGAGKKDAIVGLSATLVVLLAVWAFGLLAIVAFLAVLAIGGGVALYALIDRRIAAARVEPIRQAREIVARMRVAGKDERNVHRAVATAAGERWEEFFETLFGYDAKLSARTTLGHGDDGRGYPRFRPWRDPVLRWIDARLRARREAADQRTLEEQVEKQLIAEGVPAAIARQKARNRVRNLLDHPEQAGETYAVQASDAPDKRQMQYLALLATMDRAEEETEEEPSTWEKARDAAAVPLGVIFGPRARFLWGCALVAGCLLWMHQNGVLRQPSEEEWNQTVRKFGDLGTAIQESGTQGALVKSEQLAVERSGRYKPLELPILPATVTAVFDSFNPGIAGLVLILSAFVAGLKISLFVFPAAAAMLLTHTTGILGLVPALGNSLTSLTIGLILAVAGFLFGRI